MTKQVSISMLKEDNKIYDEFIEVPVDYDEQEHIIKVYPYFKPTKVQKLVDSLVDFYKSAQEENISIPKEEESDIIAYFIVKFFTDVKFANSKKAKTMYDEFKIVLNAKIFQFIFKLFPEDSIKEVHERINDVIEASQRIQLVDKQIHKTVAELQLESKKHLKK
ncbi:hypothetical protein V7122_19400 [Bacillus sp. JJ1532]|uniref:hypothetical protein n=1 Tax=Bacillus sp. JJ1532 TaxID=3122958 RepID=UPI002FFF909B